MITAGSIVWVQGLRGPTPEKWPADAPNGVKEGKTILAEHKLTIDEYELTLPILEQRYPPPAPKEE
jgi:hypothetical protein